MSTSFAFVDRVFLIWKDLRDSTDTNDVWKVKHLKLVSKQTLYFLTNFLWREK